MYRGEVVRTGGGESRPADPISQSDKLKLYLVINMILCVIFQPGMECESCTLGDNDQ